MEDIYENIQNYGNSVRIMDNLTQLRAQVLGGR